MAVSSNQQLELLRVAPEEFTVRRQRRGRGFVYLDEAGRLADGELVERAKSLMIPPAWQDVYLCSDERGHIQAHGIDAAGRRQYMYHPDWRKQQDQVKFEEMLEFARRLPELRAAIDRDLRRRKPTRERVLAAAIHLLDCGLFRLGSEQYARTENGKNGTYGLATLRRDHVRLGGHRLGLIEFNYRAKSGKHRSLIVRDRRVHRLLERILREDPWGDQLLSYLEDGWWVDIRSFEINERIKELVGDEFSAKDFRTWNATSYAAVRLAVYGPIESEHGRQKLERQVCKEVSDALGNTPAVCRSSYIDPRVFERYQMGVTIEDALAEIETPSWPFANDDRLHLETAVLEMLGDAQEPASLVADLTAQVERHRNSNSNGHAPELTARSLEAALRASLRR